MDDLKSRISEILKSIDPDMLVRVWQEMEYRFDVYCVAKSHMLNIWEKFNGSFVSLIFEFKVLLRKLKITSLKQVWLSCLLHLFVVIK